MLAPMSILTCALGPKNTPTMRESGKVGAETWKPGMEDLETGTPEAFSREARGPRCSNILIDIYIYIWRFPFSPWLRPSWPAIQCYELRPAFLLGYNQEADYKFCMVFKAKYQDVYVTGKSKGVTRNTDMPRPDLHRHWDQHSKAKVFRL